jgi:hypothetical protein
MEILPLIFYQSRFFARRDKLEVGFPVKNPHNQFLLQITVEIPVRILLMLGQSVNRRSVNRPKVNRPNGQTGKPSKRQTAGRSTGRAGHFTGLLYFGVLL